MRATRDGEDPGYRFAHPGYACFGAHSFRFGEYVSIKEDETGEVHTFRVVSVAPV